MGGAAGAGMQPGKSAGKRGPQQVPVDASVEKSPISSQIHLTRAYVL